MTKTVSIQISVPRILFAFILEARTDGKELRKHSQYRSCNLRKRGPTSIWMAKAQMKTIASESRNIIEAAIRTGLNICNTR